MEHHRLSAERIQRARLSFYSRQNTRRRVVYGCITEARTGRKGSSGTTPKASQDAPCDATRFPGGAVIEYITDPNILYSRTIFATHYHELNQMAKLQQGIFNCHVDVKEKEDGVVFLHKIVPGGTSDSYGIEVARLAGIPDEVLRRSRSILSELERIGTFKVNNKETENGQVLPSAAAMPGQESLFNPENVYYRKEDKLRKALRDIDVTKITPLEAMNILYGLTELLEQENEN